MSSYQADTGRALFMKYNTKREENKVAKTVFKNKIADWNTAEELKELSDHFYLSESGRVITRLSVVSSFVIKDTF
eukprot:3431443-Rhodomonas_salina.1